MYSFSTTTRKIEQTNSTSTMKKPEYDLSLTSYPKIKKVVTPIPNFPPIGSVVDSQRGVDEFVVPAEGIVILWQELKQGGGIPLRRQIPAQRPPPTLDNIMEPMPKNGDITDEEFCITQKRCYLERKQYS